METLQRTANRGSISTGYDIDNSLKLEADNAEYLERGFGSIGTPTSDQKATISLWVKRTELQPSGNHICFIGYATNTMILGFNNDRLSAHFSHPAGTNLKSSAVFRDTSAWYHLVWAFDTTQATASNREKMYVNGVQITAFDTETYPTQNSGVGLWEVNMGHYIGWSDAQCQSGYHAEIYLIDGQQLAPTDFGEFDADTGIWKPKEYTGTFGNEGYYLNFSNSADLREDSSGNSNNFTAAYNITSADQATDTPTNNFATNNPLAQNDMNPLQGATQWTHNNASDWESSISTIGVTKGKWYFEASMDSTGNFIGIIANNGITSSLNCMDTYIGDRLDTQNAGIGYHGAGNVFQNDGFTSGMPSYGGGNIISCALDMDNGYVYFAKNGSWINSGDPTSGSSGTGGWAVYDTSDIQFFATSIYSTSDNIKCNWGGFTIYSIASGNADANGYGNFEYAPPTGYYALCSKNLAEFG